MEIAIHATELGLREELIASALLYYPFMLDGLKESDFTIASNKTKNKFLETLTILVDVSKKFEYFLPWIQLDDDEEKSIKNETHNDKKKFWQSRTASNLPNAFLALSRNPEIAILKTIDRLHLLKLLPKFQFPPRLKTIVAQNSLTLYAQVSELIGLWAIKSQIEDLSFKILKPKEYQSIAKDLDEHRIERQSKIDKAIRTLSEILTADGISASIHGRVKHLYGIYTKMIQTKKQIREINDNLGIRIIVHINQSPISNSMSDNNTKDLEAALCFQVLGILFSTFSPARGIYENGKLFRDWISTPKTNGYQSIHTTVIFEGELLEVQIRSQAMHDFAEYGAAAHWVYKKTGKSDALRKKYQSFVDMVSKLRKTYEN